MIQIIVQAFVEDKEQAVVQVVFASENKEKVEERFAELTKAHPNDYLAIYDLPLDTDLTTLGHYPSVAVGKEEFI